MVKTFIDLQTFLLTVAPLLTSLGVLTLLSVLLSKSIKKHATIYYIGFSIPFLMVAVPTVLRWCGVDMGFSFSRVPVLGGIIRDYIHAGTLAHPLLIIIMYMGALDTRRPLVKKLMSIRKELSIISGFPILTHSLVRVSNNFPRSLKFFTNHTEFMENATYTSELGVGISNFSLVLGIVLVALFIPLWVTSFDAVHRRMGSLRWKRLQKWSYLLYAVLFIHAMGIQIGGMLNPRGGGNELPRTEIAADRTAVQHGANSGNSAASGGQRIDGVVTGTVPRGGERPADVPDRGNAQSGEGPGRDETTEKGEGRTRSRENGEHTDGRENRSGGGSRADGVNESGQERESRVGRERPVDGPEMADRAEQASNGQSGERLREGAQTTTATPAARQSGGRAQAKGLADIKVSAGARRWIHIVTLLSIYGSYLFLRIRKARRAAKRKSRS